VFLENGPSLCPSRVLPHLCCNYTRPRSTQPYSIRPSVSSQPLITGLDAGDSLGLIGEYILLKPHLTFLISHLMHWHENRSFCVTQELEKFFLLLFDGLESIINITNNFQMIRTSADLNSRFSISRFMAVSLIFLFVSCHKLLNLVLRIQKYRRSYFIKCGSLFLPLNKNLLKCNLKGF